MVEAPKSIRERADECRAQIDAMQADLDAAPSGVARSILERRIQMLEELENWFKAREGYE